MRELPQSFVNFKSLINSNNIWNNQYIFVGDLLGGKNDDPPVLVCVVILCLPGRRSACCGIRYYLHATIIRTHLDYSCRHQCNSECLSTCCCLFQFFHPLDSKENLYIWCWTEIEISPTLQIFAPLSFCCTSVASLNEFCQIPTACQKKLWRKFQRIPWSGKK